VEVSSSLKSGFNPSFPPPATMPRRSSASVASSLRSVQRPSRSAKVSNP